MGVWSAGPLIAKETLQAPPPPVIGLSLDLKCANLRMHLMKKGFKQVVEIH